VDLGNRCSEKVVVADSRVGSTTRGNRVELLWSKLEHRSFCLHAVLKVDADMSDTLIQLFAEVLHVDPAQLNEDSSPENVKQWDSLAAMDLVAAIEEKFNVRLSTKEIMKMSTIGRARKTLQAKSVPV
jgi:acyl carrier protein